MKNHHWQEENKSFFLGEPAFKDFLQNLDCQKWFSSPPEYWLKLQVGNLYRCIGFVENGLFYDTFNAQVIYS